MKVVVEDASMAKMSGGDVDVEPFLVSRNTLGNDEPQLKLLKPNAEKCFGVGSGQVLVVLDVSKGLAEVRWWWSRGVCGGVGGGGENCRKCNFGGLSRLIRTRSRMIRADPDDPGQDLDDPGGSTCSGMARVELENGHKFGGFADFGGILRWRWWGKARSTCSTTNSRIKTNKTSSKLTKHKKKFRGYFCGDFWIRTKNNKIKLENEKGCSDIVINLAPIPR